MAKVARPGVAGIVLEETRTSGGWPASQGSAVLHQVAEIRFLGQRGIQKTLREFQRQTFLLLGNKLQSVVRLLPDGPARPPAPT